MYRFLMLLPLLLLALVGCDETKQTITLNPDGSGKMVYSVVHSLSDEFLQQNRNAAPEILAKEYAGSLLKHSDGIDAWRDVAFHLSDDQKKVVFSGTAYFPNLELVRITASPNVQINGMRDWKVQAGDDGLVLTLGSAGKKTEGQPPANLSAEQVEQEAVAARELFDRQFGAVSEILRSLREEYVVELPAAPEESVIFQEAETPRSVRLLYDGKEMVAALKAITRDLSWWEERVRKGEKPNDALGLTALNQQLFGNPGPARITLRGNLQPQFDYEQEVLAAQLGMEAMVMGVGLGEEALPPATGEGFSALRVGGVQLVQEADQELGAMPFNQSKPGYTLSLIGTFSGAVLEVAKTEITEAITMEGISLLDEKIRRYAQKALSHDRRTLVFEAALAPPPPDASGLRAIAGAVTYKIAQGTTAIDLGTAEIKPGTFGEHFGLTIDELRDSKWDENRKELHLNFAEKLPAPLKELNFYTPAGIQLKTQQTSTMHFNNRLQLVYLLPAESIGALRLELVLHDNVRTFEIPFRLEDLDLLGRPLKK